MKRISRRKNRKQIKVFFYTLGWLLMKEGYYTRYVRRERILWVHERKGQPILYSVKENGQVTSLREVQTNEDRQYVRIEKCAVNARELAKSLLGAKKQRVRYPNNLRERLSVLAEFGDYQLLCNKERGIFMGYSFLIKHKEMPAMYRNIFRNYEEAKAEFAAQANIIDGWMDLPVIKAMGCAVRYYQDNAVEYRPYIKEALEKAERNLIELSARGWNALYDYSLDMLDDNMRDTWMAEADANAPVCAD